MLRFEDLKLIEYKDLKDHVGNYVIAGNEKNGATHIGRLVEGEFLCGRHEDRIRVKGQKYAINLMDIKGVYAGLETEERYEGLRYKAYTLNYDNAIDDFESLVGKWVYVEFDNEINYGKFIKVDDRPVVDCVNDEIEIDSPYAVLYDSEDEHGCTYLSIEHEDHEVSIFLPAR